ncbi:MAG: hypothetical protein E7454_05010 [Ruminococcaceae bacterium]|nr:hypothetical protein [Oscillospiraceae bacterium]
MLTSFSSKRLLQERNHSWCVYALCAVTGAGLGVYTAASFGQPFILMMRTALSSPVSIVGSIVAVFLPYFISLIAILTGSSFLKRLVCWLMIFRYTSTAWCIAQCFGTAGWLIRVLAQLPDMILIPVLVWLTIQHNYRFRKSIILACFTVCLLLITLIQCYFVSPYLTMLLNT